jgi:hypothetical protein
LSEVQRGSPGNSKKEPRSLMNTGQGVPWLCAVCTRPPKPHTIPGWSGQLAYQGIKNRAVKIEMGKSIKEFLFIKTRIPHVSKIDLIAK